MSYILDALRRADAERERGEVPGLQSQQHAMRDDDEAPPRPRGPVWVIAALSLALVAALAWNFLGGEPPRPVQGAEAARPAPATAPAITSAITPAVMPAIASTTAPATAPAAIVEAPPAPSTASPPPALPDAAVPAAALARASQARRVEARRPAPAPDTRVAAATPSTPAPPAAASSTRGAAQNRVFTQAELPEDVRREIPRLTIAGASYSGDAASRMVIINGQVFHEGDKIVDGLVLQQIKLKAAVLAYKGWRYEITY